MMNPINNLESDIHYAYAIGYNHGMQQAQQTIWPHQADEWKTQYQMGFEDAKGDLELNVDITFRIFKAEDDKFE